MVTNNQYQSMFFISNEGVIVVDAPPSIGYGILFAIRNITDLPIAHQVYSHSHTDHIGASGILPTNIKRISHALTREYLRGTPDPNRPLPDETFSDELTLIIGNQTPELKSEGPNHHAGNIFIYSAAHKVLMLVDVIFPGWAPYAYLGQAEDVPGYIKAHYQALEYDFEHFVAGHLTRSGNRTDVENSLAYVLELKSSCTEAYQLGASPNNATNNLSAAAIGAAALAANPNNTFAALKAILNGLTEYCEKVTNEKFRDILAGTDVYGDENAFKMVDSLRIEFDAGGPFAVQDA
jgi:glyoxylase-like metal-dependent hydrolase (beta-lactamase superfamily II)